MSAAAAHGRLQARGGALDLALPARAPGALRCRCLVAWHEPPGASPWCSSPGLAAQQSSPPAASAGRGAHTAPGSAEPAVLLRPAAVLARSLNESEARMLALEQQAGQASLLLQMRAAAAGSKCCCGGRLCRLRPAAADSRWRQCMGGILCGRPSATRPSLWTGRLPPLAAKAQHLSWVSRQHLSFPTCSFTWATVGCLGAAAVSAECVTGADCCCHRRAARRRMRQELQPGGATAAQCGQRGGALCGQQRLCAHAHQARDAHPGCAQLDCHALAKL